MREGESVGVFLFLKTFQASLAHVENFWFSLESNKVEKVCNKFNFLPSATSFKTSLHLILLNLPCIL